MLAFRVSGFEAEHGPGSKGFENFGRLSLE